MWKSSGEVWGSEFGGENPEHLAKLDKKYYRPFGAKLRRAPQGEGGVPRPGREIAPHG